MLKNILLSIILIFPIASFAANSYQICLENNDTYQWYLDMDGSYPECTQEGLSKSKMAYGGKTVCTTWQVYTNEGVCPYGPKVTYTAKNYSFQEYGTITFQASTASTGSIQVYNNSLSNPASVNTTSSKEKICVCIKGCKTCKP